MKKICLLFLLICCQVSFAQDNIKGQIIEIVEGELIGIQDVSLQWLNTNIGTATDDDGMFQIAYETSFKKLIVSKIGYKTDTVEVKSIRYVRHALKQEAGELEEVTIELDRKSTSIPFYSIANTSIVSSDELLKAACCNLSESFETNPSIDVSFSDAVIGIKHINMLGLDSPYILISQENIPMVRGASQTFGLTFTPGTWIESIQISKGAGSVINGYESIVGQINTELVKPYSDDNIFVNAYGADDGRLELNTHFNHDFNKKWSGGLYLHGRSHFKKFDDNNDGFLDSHIANQYNIMNRWQYQDTEKGWIGFLSFRYLNDDILIGQVDFDPDTDKGTTNAWGGEILTERFDTSLKIGYVFPDLPYQSFGLQASYSSHDQNSYFGLTDYNISQESWYSNLIFNSIIYDTRHKFKTGISFTHDNYKEQLNLNNYDRNDTSIGGFFEYTYDNLENLNIVAGIRADQHNKLGFFITPRVYLRYDTPWEKGVVRASVGNGRKIANIFSEHQHAFVTNRDRIIEENGGKVYGLQPEFAWNYGVSFQQGFYVFGANGDIVLDYYSTRFKNQVVIDWEESGIIKYYNLEGKSWANSFQAELNYNPIKAMHIKLSYKFNDVKTDYESGRKQKPFVAKNRFFAHISYSTNKNSMRFWKFNLTYNWVDRQRFPEMSQNPPEYSVPEYSPKTNYISFQVTRVFSSIFEIYLGGENITNTKQVDPIISSENPFGTYFDGAQLYAPTTGSRYYIGLRYRLNNREE